jgi:hypothetical protein
MIWKGENGGGLAAGLRAGAGECELYPAPSEKKVRARREKGLSTRGRIPVVNECDGQIERAGNERAPSSQRSGEYG